MMDSERDLDEAAFADFIRDNGRGAGLLAEVMRQAIIDLDAEHQPITNPADVGPRGGCVICWPRDGLWPCVTRSVANDLRAALDRDSQRNDRGTVTDS